MTPFRWQNCYADVQTCKHDLTIQSYFDDVIVPALETIEEKIETLDKSDWPGAVFAHADMKDMLRESKRAFGLSIHSIWERQLAYDDIDLISIFGKLSVERALSEKSVRTAFRRSEPRAHVTFVIGKLRVQLAGEESGMLGFNESERRPVAALKVAGEAVDREPIGDIEAGAVSAADLGPGRTAREGALDDLVQLAFDRGRGAVFYVVMKTFVVADPIDRLTIGDDEVAVPFQHPHLVRIVGARETAKIELRDVVVSLGRIRGH